MRTIALLFLLAGCSSSAPQAAPPAGCQMLVEDPGVTCTQGHFVTDAGHLTFDDAGPGFVATSAYACMFDAGAAPAHCLPYGIVSLVGGPAIEQKYCCP
jgi:hypothetical protein